MQRLFTPYGIALLLFTLLSASFAWSAWYEYRAFKRQAHQVASLSAKTASARVAEQIDEKRRMVAWFAQEQLPWILAFREDNPAGEGHEWLSAKAHGLFPDAFALSIADAKGNPLIVDFDGLVEQVCQNNIRQFAHDRQGQEIFVHPNPHVYHYDIMAHAGDRILFMSYRLEDIAAVLVQTQQSVLGQQLMLIHRGIPGLIEVSAEGPRSAMKRDFRLSPDELGAVLARVPVPGTLWDMVAIEDRAYHADALRSIRLRFLSITLAVAFMTALLT